MAPLTVPHAGPRAHIKGSTVTFDTADEALDFGREASIWTPSSTIAVYQKPPHVGGYGIATGGAPNGAGIQLIAIFKAGQKTWSRDAAPNTSTSDTRTANIASIGQSEGETE